MRRQDKEIQDPAVLRHILEAAQVCRLGLCRDSVPYIVPVSFGYDGEDIYFHTAMEGRKLDFLAVNNRICFELEHEVAVIPHDARACHWSFSFYCIIGYGMVEELTADADRLRGLQQVMRHYSGRQWDLQAEHLAKVRVWRLRIESLSGKCSRDKLAVTS